MEIENNGDFDVNGPKLKKNCDEDNSVDNDDDIPDFIRMMWRKTIWGVWGRIETRQDEPESATSPWYSIS